MVGNPANTNCLLTAKMAPSIPSANFTCLTRLDQNRAVAQVKSHGPVHVTLVYVTFATGAATPRLLRGSRFPMTALQTSSYGGTTPPPSFRMLLMVTWTEVVRRFLCTMQCRMMPGSRESSSRFLLLRYQFCSRCTMEGC